MTLTPKQARFVEQYLVDGNATQAAIRAGYSARTAHVIGGENIRKPAIASALAAARQKLSERTELTQDWVVDRLRENAAAAAANEDFGPANRAVELIGKHLGMFVERHDHTVRRDVSDLTDEALAALIHAGRGGNGASAPTNGAAKPDRVH